MYQSFRIRVYALSGHSFPQNLKTAVVFKTFLTLNTFTDILKQIKTHYNDYLEVLTQIFQQKYRSLNVFSNDNIE